MAKKKKKPLRNPYSEYEKKLFCPDTSSDQLQYVCMVLAHEQTRKAQALLDKFEQSRRAGEVPWLSKIREQTRWTEDLEPGNEQEERDLLALKMVQEIEDEMVELEISLREARLDLSRYEIEFQAVSDLAKKREIDSAEKNVYRNKLEQSRMKAENLAKIVRTKEKISREIEKSIKTERYRSLDSGIMRNIHYS